jgi:hypothetical protein
MLYIHQLKDLTPKSADIEGTFIIRELKVKTPLPLTEDKIRNYFTLFFISESEKTVMAEAVELIESTVEDIQALLHSNDADYEPVNLQRAINMLREIPTPLLANLNFAKVISIWQEDLVLEFAPLFNTLPDLKSRSYEERVAVNQKLNEIFERLLRNNVMAFSYKDIIYEAQTSRMNDLVESMNKGFFFHIFLEEELKKLDFETVKRRIPNEKLVAVQRVDDKIERIKKGVDAAYDVNVRMMNWGLVVYAYIKWLNG